MISPLEVMAECVRQRPRIRAVLEWHGVPSSLSEDGAQEVLLCAWRRINDFEPDPRQALSDAVGGWLYGIAWRHASDVRDALRVRARASGTGEGSTAHPSAALEARDELRAVAGRLRNHERRIVALAAEGYTGAAIAKRLRINPEALYKILKRARKRIGSAA